MISYITGKIVSSEKQNIVVALGPIALQISVADPAVFQIGKDATVHLHMHWNQENGPTFYGFADSISRTVFLFITSCSGIGPKIGLAVLHDLGAQGFLQAIEHGDERALSKVSGIGLKKAEQIVVQLKHKVGQLVQSGVDLGDANTTSHWHTLTEALQSLNYSRNEINLALNQIKKQPIKESATFDQLLRHALSLLSKQS